MNSLLQSFQPPTTNCESTGYYIVPPGYVDPEGKSVFSQRASRPNSQSGGTWSRSTVTDGEKTTASGWVDDRKYPFSIKFKGRFLTVEFAGWMPALSHHDWTIPQAKQILSHWATLASLLAGTQATLMGFYEKSKTQSPAYKFIIAISCASLFLHIYGALLSAFTIIASISLQAPPCGSEKKPLSPRAAAILDRFTVAVGYIIPLGALFELVGLATYAARYLNKYAVTLMALSLFFCVVTTLVAAISGWRTGSQRQEVLRLVKHQARHWDQPTPEQHRQEQAGPMNRAI